MNIDRIRAAHGRIKSTIRETPLLSAPFLDDLVGKRVLVKAECLQITGSFKFRGATSAISALSEADRQHGIVAFSSGNHAQGVALAAQKYDAPATIIMPADAPRVKIENTQAYGAEVILYDRASEDRDEIGARLVAEKGLTLIKPFDNEEVIAGQGTCGLEIAAQTQGIEEAAVLVCCGGGGFLSGIATALADEKPGFTCHPVEPEGFDDVARSLISGRIERNAQTSGNICDAIISPSPGQITFPIMQRLCGPGLTVSEEEALRAMAMAFEHLRVVAEPGGAVALAAALFRTSHLPQDTIIATISGGNVDAAMFQRALEML
ncbi:threonine ammonia-lyase [Primorskyibacter sp. S187A]|uniref:threonine ammonia-lyase n=1 Tax=Primorskyibacter sp. S187A TaxID=3415130 RepID=UPI003C7C2573